MRVEGSACDGARASDSMYIARNRGRGTGGAEQRARNKGREL